ncbi:5'-nucleotidase [Oleiphilus sp. HI0071]|uniref:5'-nucleotidase n=2 Tax=Oleiphilus sp. HI0080 TaxID=1822255 RepID=UPI0007C3EAC6|nr:5'-nucleotidase [Oleiphilus sp. HI0080]KZY60182.1 5'-nucleotidase [Oleiphilus sp. HI0065]KZY82495.1 5'-nucleotidase [Oleiphilus sp. HI0071]KZY90151.1 5'-nucleotidase [Oleiphilus sp. HI0073]KZZ49668.1 5'-nucleotidase [Oleiphilus sp. HI0122]KZZ19093.1 5'-nucleotidase [Oleiphilus sp. HI0080]
MPAYPIDQKLVIAVSSSALFDLSESDKVFRENGAKAYKEFQEAHLDKVLNKGVAFPFIRRFLSINDHFPELKPVEVVLLSRNSTTTGRRVFRSIRHYGLDISRAAFLTGSSPFPYIPAFNASLFLSQNEADVKSAINVNYPAGIVMPSKVNDDETDVELRVAFDFDGVIADDEAETVYKQGDLNDFEQHETSKQTTPHNPGPLADLFRKLAGIQRLETEAQKRDASYKRVLRTAIVTARNAPSHERVITTLESWGVWADETFFLGGMEKNRILGVLKPHMFFDDQRTHLLPTGDNVPMVHIPFGVANSANKSE